MNGPRIVCCACGAPTSIRSPLCVDCAAFADGTEEALEKRRRRAEALKAAQAKLERLKRGEW